MSVILLADVKKRLNKTGTTDDAELQDMIDAAESYYARMIGPLTGTVTETFDGGGTALVLSNLNVSAITAAGYTDGTTISTGDLTLNTASGIVYWGFGTAGRFTWGSRNVTLTYTIGTLPAEHKETIIADVAGYFQATQRAGSGRPSFTGEAGYEEAYASSPQILFPRIRELAKSYPSVA